MSTKAIIDTLTVIIRNLFRIKLAILIHKIIDIAFIYLYANFRLDLFIYCYSTDIS